jgi:hypothetical protein
MLAPQEVDQAIHRDDLAGVQKEDRQQRTLLGRPELGDRTVRGHLERAEQAKVHRIRRHGRVPPLPIIGLGLR